MEESFPRGGVQRKPGEAAVKKRRREDDNLFCTRHEEEEEATVRKKRKKELKEKVQPEPQHRRPVTKATGVQLLSYKDLRVGMLFLACVREVKDVELVVALPYGLTGYVKATNLCDAYTKMLSEQVSKAEPLEDLLPLCALYSPGMLLRCTISGLDTTSGGFNSIQLSLNPKLLHEDLAPSSLHRGMFLSGLVSSVEDHGYLIDLGVNGSTAFLPRHKAQAYLKQTNKGGSLSVGQYLHCVVEEVKHHGRLCQLSVLQSDVAAAIATDEQQWTLHSLLPGLVVKARIQKVLRDHVLLSFLSSYTGVADFLHFEATKANSYQKDQEVKACVLWIDRSSKSIRLTLRKPFLQPGSPVQQITSDWMGSVLESCTVKALYKKAGAVFTLDGDAAGFAFKANFNCKNFSDLSAFKEHTVHTGRVVGFSPMDGMHLLNFKGKVVEGLYLRHEDLQAGQILEGTVGSLVAEGMVVNITMRLNGLVPNLHLADVTLRHPEKKYTSGKKIKCKVLNVNPSAKKLILTCKKTMIASKLPIIASFHDAKPGMIAHGFIWAVGDFGCIVKFYNDVHGLTPPHELSAAYIPSPQKVFRKGQVAKVRVLDCNPEKETLLLSFKIYEDEENGEQPKERKRAARNALPQHEPGKTADVRIVSKAEDGLTVLILPEESPAVLTKPHLSDHGEICGLLYRGLEEGDVVPGVMCLHNPRGRTIMTRKPALISAVERGVCVKDFADIQLGVLLTGFVRSIMSYGVFVEFLNGLVGLVPISQVSDKYVTCITDHVVIGKTVVARVTDIDEEKKRFLLTLKLTQCAPDNSSSEESFSHLSRYFTDLKFAKDLMKRSVKPEDDGETILSLLPGKIFNLVVEEVKENGLIEFTCSKISGAQKISAVQREDDAKKFSPGQKVKAAVLHVDIMEAHVHVSVEDTLLKKSKVTFAESSVYSAVVQHLAEEFAVVSLEDTSVMAAVPLTSHFNDNFQFESEKLSLGQQISVRLLSVKANEHGLLLAIQNTTKDKRKVPVKTGKRKPVLGDVITGTVKSVKPTSVLVSLPDTLAGTIHASEIVDDVSLGSIPTSRLRPQQSITCRVIGGRDIKSHKFLPITHPNLMKSILELSIRPSLVNSSREKPEHKTLKMYSSGDTVTCYVTKYNKEKAFLEVEIAPAIRGQVERLLLSSSPKVLKRPEKHFKLGQALSATVIGLDFTHKLLSLSLIDTLGVKEGLVTTGCVKSVEPGSGLVISLPGGKTGRANLCQLNDCYGEATVEKYSVGTFVRCCILSVGKKEVRVSLRKSRINPTDAHRVIDEDISSIDGLEEGQLVKGFVGTVNDKGVFFRISSSIDGHIPFSNATCYFVEDVEKFKLYIPEGKLLTAKIISIDKEKKHIQLSLLSDDTGNPDVIPESAGFELRFGSGKKKRQRKESESEVKQWKKKKKAAAKPEDDEDSGVELYCRETESRKPTTKKSGGKAPASRLQVSSGFSWDVSLHTLKTAAADGKESSSDSEDEVEKLPKTKAAQKAEAGQKKQSEKKAATPSGQQPQSLNEFERLVLSSPNSSANWVQYMDFHLQASELEQARAVAERALQTIYFREEQEKLNVWVAMMNMENTYGTEETLMKVFERAVQYNDPLKAFQHLVEIYIQSEKYKEADELFNTMVKRFRQEQSVYWKYAQYLHKHGQPDAAHRLLQRALKCLPEKEHVDVISKFAQLEFRLGDPVRAKALFESTLSSYPKRTDIWSVYIDMMVKHGSQKEVRDIFERVIHLSLAAKRIKFFFKRYLDYEKKRGTEKTVQAVKEKALQYVESKSSLGAS